MARIVRLRPWHLVLIEPQPEQAMHARPQLNEDFGEALLSGGPAWVCCDAEKVYGAAGFVFEEGRALAWAILSRYAGEQMLAITRAARREFENVKAPIEAYVREGFAAGERWASMLGLARAGVMVGPNGLTYGKWVR